MPDLEIEEVEPEDPTVACSSYRCRNETPESEVLIDPYNGDAWCDEHIMACARCGELRGEPYTQGVVDGTRFVGAWLCNDCYTPCSGCGAVIYGMERCSDCSEEDVDEEDEVEGLHSYSYKPVPIFRGSGPLYLGVEQEMEFESGREAAEVLRYIRNLDTELLYVKHDGSLSMNGMEIVSHPMSPDYAINEYPWGLQTAIAQNGGVPDNNAGLHIHVSRSAFSKYHLWKFTYFHYANPQFVAAIAGRTSEQWASLGSHPARRRITKPGAVDIAVGDDSLAKQVRRKTGTHSRYTAVNLCNEHTAELRYFASTYDPEVLKGYFDYVKALYAFTNIARVRNRKDNSRDLSGLAFRKWAVESGDYPHFTRLLEIRGIPLTSLGKTVNNVGMTWKEQ